MEIKVDKKHAHINTHEDDSLIQSRLGEQVGDDAAARMMSCGVALDLSEVALRYQGLRLQHAALSEEMYKLRRILLSVNLLTDAELEALAVQYEGPT